MSDTHSDNQQNDEDQSTTLETTTPTPTPTPAVNTRKYIPSDRRVNGLSRPFSTPQLLAWIVFVATALEFGLFCTPTLPLAAAIVLTILFYFVWFAIVYYGGLTQSIDPADHFVLGAEQQLNKEHCDQINKDVTPKGLIATLYANYWHNLVHPPISLPKDVMSEHEAMEDGHSHQQPDIPTKHCWFCEIQVAETSMHCKNCNKCVKVFDHHCMCTYGNTMIEFGPQKNLPAANAYPHAVRIFIAVRCSLHSCRVKYMYR